MGPPFFCVSLPTRTLSVLSLCSRLQVRAWHTYWGFNQALSYQSSSYYWLWNDAHGGAIYSRGSRRGCMSGVTLPGCVRREHDRIPHLETRDEGNPSETFSNPRRASSYADDASLVVGESTFEQNSAQGEGGALYAHQPSSTHAKSPHASL